MAGKKDKVLTTTVILVDVNGQPVTFLKGDVPEKEYADQIGDHAWGYLDASGNVVEDAADAADPADEPEDEDDLGPDDDETEDEAPDTGDEGSDDDVPEPPRSGKGSGKGAWAEFAASKGIELGDDATAKDYQDAVDAL